MCLVAGVADCVQVTAEWALADKAQSYDGKFYSADDAKGVMAAWWDGDGK